MRHLRHAATVTDPETGRVYPVPMGGSSNEPPPGTDDGTGSETDDGTDDGSDEDEGDDDGEGDDGDKGRKGGDAQLRADLARERKRRQDAERALRERERENESDVDKVRREAREEALAPARNLARRQAVTDAAREVGFLDATDAYAALVAGGELDAIEVDDDALTVVDPDTITDTLSKLAKRKPHLLTAEARARIEGRRSSGTNGSSVDGSSSGSGKPADDGAWLLARR